MNGEELSYALSTYHAILATIFSAVYAPRFVNLKITTGDEACYYECNCPDDLWKGVYAMCIIMVIYFALDIVAMKSSGNVPLVVLFHHSAFGFAGMLQLWAGRNCGPFSWLIGGELSTIFLNARWFLKRSGRSSSRLYVIVQGLFAVTFFLTRVLIYGVGLYDFVSNDPNIFRRVEVWQIIPFLFVAMYGLNLYWFSKILRIVFKGIKVKVSPPSFATTLLLILCLTTTSFSLFHSSIFDHEELLTVSAQRAGTLTRVWDNHMKAEFHPNHKSVIETMKTMNAHPSVNHVPTQIGGVGTRSVAEFYTSKFIFQNPAMDVTPVSRTIGKNSIVDEMIINLTHDRAIPWLVPSLEPTFATITFPLVAIVIFEGDLISHERIYWDQATVLKQLGVIDASISDVTGPEQASLLPSDRKSVV